MAETDTRYRAPALEKGLDILELLSGVHTPLTSAEIADRLLRSKAELYRMLHVLEGRGYVEKPDGSDGYVVTSKLLALGTERRPVADLLDFALPLMRELSDTARQSCHLAVRSGTELVVIARAETPGAISYSVRVGYRRPFAETASGRVIYAHSSEPDRSRIEAALADNVPRNVLTEFQRQSKAARDAGFWRGESAQVTGVNDLSAPIRDGRSCIAALTMPFIVRRKPVRSQDKVLADLRGVAKMISDALAAGSIGGL